MMPKICELGQSMNTPVPNTHATVSTTYIFKSAQVKKQW